MQGYFSQHVFPLNILFMYIRGFAINYAEHISSGYIYRCKCQICYRLRPIIIKHDFINTNSCLFYYFESARSI